PNEGGGQGGGEHVDVESDLPGQPHADVESDLPGQPNDLGEPEDTRSDAIEVDPDTESWLLSVPVTVTIDGEPAVETLLVQGGNPARWTTDSEGKATVEVDRTVPGDLFVMASHPEARIAGQSVHKDDPFFEDTDEVVIALTRFDPSDNEDYVFKDPGEPGNSHVIEKCAHCHLTVADSWGDSVHRSSAKNPLLHDLYEGTALGTSNEADCTARGGTWIEDVHPSTGDPRFRCKVTDGVVDHDTTGACADCHAPGIDGAVGGRDLRDATGRSFEEGAHCDVCHHVESVHLGAGPGVAGSLKIVRPSEEAPFAGVGTWHPLTFCPNPDNANKLMSCVQRDHFRESAFCAGCHEYEQAVLVKGASIDTERWPEGKLPVQTTHDEWLVSGLAGAMSCQGCHMPTAPPEVENGADLQAFSGDNTGITGGWPRPHGSVRLHSWSGPRSPEEVKLANPLGLKVEMAEVADGAVTVTVTVSNDGAGHAIPTGEPLRAVVLAVTAACGEDALVATGGDAVPDFGGAYAMKSAGEDWNTWPGATVGQVVRVVSRTGDHHDYTGHGPFGDGTFDAAAKGLPVELVVGQATIATVDGDAVTFDAALPTGD
ncbi:MAG: hypothetical protein QF464_13865, partial [Myxococcota bacterium]|nr:hypothetical protein [Myxococcota bacterium]